LIHRAPLGARTLPGVPGVTVRAGRRATPRRPRRAGRHPLGHPATSSVAEQGRGADRAERACQFTIRSPAVCPVAGTSEASSWVVSGSNRAFALVTWPRRPAPVSWAAGPGSRRAAPPRGLGRIPTTGLLRQVSRASRRLRAAYGLGISPQGLTRPPQIPRERREVVPRVRGRISGRLARRSPAAGYGPWNPGSRAAGPTPRPNTMTRNRPIAPGSIIRTRAERVSR
jgi:hypothetical protein